MSLREKLERAWAEGGCRGPLHRLRWSTTGDQGAHFLEKGLYWVRGVQVDSKKDKRHAS